MSNNSVSPKFLITNQKFTAQSDNTVKRYTTGSVSPPTFPASGVSTAIKKWINPYPDIAFEKIILPQWKGISEYTTQVSNQPDYIKDYHFIALMRCCDYFLETKYVGLIEGNTNPPSPFSEQ